MGDLSSRRSDRRTEIAHEIGEYCLAVTPTFGGLPVPDRPSVRKQVPNEILHSIGTIDVEPEELRTLLIDPIAEMLAKQLGVQRNISHGLLQVVRGDIGELL